MHNGAKARLKVSEGWDIGRLIILVPKFYCYHVSYFLTLKLWGFLLDFYWLVHKVDCPNVLTNNVYLSKE